MKSPTVSAWYSYAKPYRGRKEEEGRICKKEEGRKGKEDGRCLVFVGHVLFVVFISTSI